MTDAAPVLVHLDRTDVQQRDDGAGGSVDFRVVVSAHAGPSRGLVHSVTMLKSGQSDARHTHDVPMTAHVLDGAGTVDLGTVTHEVAKGDTLFLPAGSPHEWAARDNGLTLFLSFAADRWDEVSRHSGEKA